MNIEPYSRHIFWSYRPDADLPENLIVRQVIAYGEISDFKLICKTIPHNKIKEAIGSWKNQDQYKKQIEFLEKIFLYDQP